MRFSITPEEIPNFISTFSEKESASVLYDCYKNPDPSGMLGIPYVDKFDRIFHFEREGPNMGIWGRSRKINGVSKYRQYNISIEEMCKILISLFEVYPDTIVYV